MSLDQIIAQRDKPRSPSNPSSSTSRSSLSIRGSRGSRTSRQPVPYHHQQQPSRNLRKPIESLPSNSQRDPASLKFLLNHYFAGIFIGSAGSSIREMEQICDASIHISNASDYYPGTKERVVFMSGSEPAVTLAQSLMWELLGQQAYADRSGDGPLLWNPSHAKDYPGQYDDVAVQGKITIPAAAAGSLIGRHGNVIKGLATETGVEVTIDSKEDAEFSHERVLTIAGTVAQCMNFTSMILHRLVRHDEAVYEVPGTTYPKWLSKPRSNGADDSSYSNIQRGKTGTSPAVTTQRTNDLFSDAELFEPSIKTSVCAETLSAFTTIELAVPETIVGGILGPHGAKLNEIVQLSGAKIVVSKRGDYIEGTTNRLVTITGSPPSAQTAHTLIIHKLRQTMDGH